jgi:hypothetical protein
MDQSDLSLFGLLALTAIVYFLWDRSRKADAEAASAETVRAPIELARVRDVYRALETTGTEGSFAILAAPQTTTPEEDDPIHLQLAIHGGKAGVDWVLLSDQNIAEQERFIQFATARGFAVDERDEDVPYLRVEAGVRSPELCIDVLRELYGLQSDDVVDLEANGFDWPASGTQVAAGARDG